MSMYCQELWNVPSYHCTSLSRPPIGVLELTAS